ncbi:Cullin 1 [Pelomyxa schiedti]|nr:Cullin 1 [Pelomyxa schiedti]
MERGKSPDAWARLWENLERILIYAAEGLTHKMWMRLYTDAFDASSAGRPKEILDAAGELMRRKIHEIVESNAHEQGTIENSVDFLTLYVQHFRKWHSAIKIVEHILAYPQRSLNPPLSVTEVGVQVWNSSLPRESVVKVFNIMIHIIINDYLAHMHAELIQHCFLSFDTETYTLFEESFLKEVDQYYRSLFTTILHEEHFPTFLVKCLSVIEQEKVKADVFPKTKETGKKFVDFIDNSVKGYQEYIEAHFVEALRTNSEDDLRRMFQLLSHTDGLATVSALFGRYAKMHAMYFIEDNRDAASSSPKVFIEQVLIIYNQYKRLLSSVFEDNTLLWKSFQNAFTDFMNNNAVTKPSPNQAVDKAPELIVQYLCDVVLFQGRDNVPEDMVEKTVIAVVPLFKTTHEETLFWLLSKKLSSYLMLDKPRLLINNFQYFVTQLKEIKFSFCAQLQNMISDITVSTSLNEEFLHHTPLPFKWNLNVVRHGLWHLSVPGTTVQVPEQLQSAVDQFQTFYSNKFTGRKLLFLLNYSSAFTIMKGDQILRLSATAYQTIILLQLEKTEQMSLNELITNTSISIAELQHDLQPLVKLRIVHCKTPQPEWNEQTVIMLSNQRVPKSSIQVGHRVDCRQFSDAKAEACPGRQMMDDRKFLLKATIVRLMKAKKKSGHAELIQQTIAEVSKIFQPSEAAIKQAIESLIEQEYIARSTDKTSEYEYVS